MTLSPKKRIFLNIVVTYGRTLLGTICGIFTARWALMALGEVDFGLFGVVGGLAAFISFFNGIFSGGIGRFYAVAVGEAKKTGRDGLEKCRQWFNTALLLQTVTPLLLIIIGYPIGCYAVRHWLTIPLERMDACIWVFRFVCISCLAGMVSVPFTAMYYAKQYIAEQTLYSTITILFNVCALYYMVTHPGIWLAKYAFLTCFSSVFPLILLSIRSIALFPECHFNWRYLWHVGRIKELIHFSGWQMFGGTGVLLKTQGIGILINKSFGPAVNAAGEISAALAGQTNTLSSSIFGAFAPAIANSYGEGNLAKMQQMSLQACKFCSLMVILFAIPLALELPFILQIWLKNPPQYVVGLCWCAIASTVIENLSGGYMLAVNATGKIAVYQAFCGTAIMLALPFAWIAVALGWGVYSIGYAGVLSSLLLTIGRVYFASRKVKISISCWLKRVFSPVFLICIVCGGFGVLPQLFQAPSIFRLILSVFIAEVFLVPLAWQWILDDNERQFLLEKLVAMKKNFVV